MVSAPQAPSSALLFVTLSEMQNRTHDWSARIRIRFDPSKEYFKILHPTLGEGEDFKLLGPLLDCKLSLQACIENFLSKIRPNIRALLRLRHLHPKASMLDQYNSHIWSVKEYSNGALILTAPHQLRRLDKVQRWYLHELHLSDTDAFVKYNFAPPPSLGKSMGILSFVHKRIAGIWHPLLVQALLFAEGLDANYHTKALHPFSGEVRYHACLD